MKHFIFLALVAAALTTPYFLLSENRGNPFRGWSKKGADDAEQAEGETTAYSDDMPRLLPDQLVQSKLDVELAPAKTLEQVLDFRVTPRWVMGTWPNVTTGLRQGEWFGYRVPLVTGTSENDVTGSLTYYFGSDQRLQRITLEGDTGDARRLVTLVTARHGLKQSYTDQREYLYRRTQSGRVISELRLRPDSVVRAAAPFQRYEVSMSLSRPPRSFGPFRFGPF